MQASVARPNCLCPGLWRSRTEAEPVRGPDQQAWSTGIGKSRGSDWGQSSTHSHADIRRVGIWHSTTASSMLFAALNVQRAAKRRTSRAVSLGLPSCPVTPSADSYQILSPHLCLHLGLRLWNGMLLFSIAVEPATEGRAVCRSQLWCFSVACSRALVMFETCSGLIVHVYVSTKVSAQRLSPVTRIRLGHCTPGNGGTSVRQPEQRLHDGFGATQAGLRCQSAFIHMGAVAKRL
jgi:hypothetical protein